MPILGVLGLDFGLSKPIVGISGVILGLLEAGFGQFWPFGAYFGPFRAFSGPGPGFGPFWAYLGGLVLNLSYLGWSGPGFWAFGAIKDLSEDGFGPLGTYSGHFEPVSELRAWIWACYVGSGPIWACFWRFGPRFWSSGHGFEPFGAYSGGHLGHFYGSWPGLGPFWGLGMDFAILAYFDRKLPDHHHMGCVMRKGP